VSRPTITQLVARRRNVTAEMALRLARYFGTSAQVWQNLQAQYDLERRDHEDRQGREAEDSAALKACAFPAIRSRLIWKSPWQNKRGGFSRRL
jgi:plasmid maintenance system antidote protein VapI